MTDIIATPVTTSSSPEVKTFDMTPSTPASASDIVLQNSEQKSEQKTLPESEVKTEEVKDNKSPEDERMTARFQELKRRERENFKKAQEIKAQEQQIKRLEELKSSPNLFERLEAVNLTFEDLVEYVVNNDKPKQQTVEQKVEQLEAKIKEKEEAELKAIEEAKHNSYQEALTNFTNAVKDIASSSVDYELIYNTESYDLVSDLVIQVSQEYGQTLPIHEAMRMVESKLQKEVEEKILKANKFKSRFQSEKTDHQANTTDKPVVPTTLTSSHSPQTTVKPTDHSLTKEQAREKALAMIRFV